MIIRLCLTEGPRKQSRSLAAGTSSPSEPAGSDEPGLRRRRFKHVWVWCLITVIAALLAAEFYTSYFQAHLLASAGQRMTFRVVDGSGLPAVPSKTGPYDERLGYAELRNAVSNLERTGYRVTKHVELSPWQQKALNWGLTPIYNEKVRAGLRLEDEQGRAIYEAVTPHEVYPTYETIPQPLVRALLFAENRQILETSLPYRNPTVEWSRLSRAVFDVGWNKVNPGHPVSGGSTVATQLEKIRHSPGGRTLSGGEKLRQMLASSLRSYQNGPRNLENREQIVADYINSLPLAATSEGEVIGLADGLRAWFGAEPSRVNQLIAMTDEQAAAQKLSADRGLAYRQAVTLLLAARRPSEYLSADRQALQQRVDTYLGLLAKNGIITASLRDQALRAKLRFRRLDPQGNIVSVPAEKKGINAVRAALANLTGVPSLYALGRLDLTARTSLDGAATEAVARKLAALADPEIAAQAGLIGHSMLASGAADGMVYSFTLYEHRGSANFLRVQADNYPQPLNINQGTKLELGSTAKLRTLATYLEIIAEIHKQLAPLTPAQLAAYSQGAPDPLSAWVGAYLAELPQRTDRSLQATLNAAMERTYSASPAESFFTGGGVHTFSNFDGKDNGRVLTVREALERSVNLVFIRVMRDVVRYTIAQHPETLAVLDAPFEDKQRQQYLSRFVESESREFLAQYYRKYKSAPQQKLNTLLTAQAFSPVRFAVTFRATRPGDSAEAFEEVADQLGAQVHGKKAESYYNEFAPTKFNWNDLGYMAHLHPLELWIASYLNRNPQATFEQAVADSAVARRESYSWFLRPHLRSEQNTRIRTLLEREAFVDIHQRWSRMGFPFGELVPSFATAIGSSGDTPEALAQLAGIVLNDGVRYPSVRLSQLHFAEATPYETVVERDPAKAERVMQSEVAATLRQAMLGVVERGTAGRARGVFHAADGSVLPIGGKTGTGDNRIEHYGAGGALTGSKVRNRTATFVFTIGDRFFGTLVAYADGQQAQTKNFTSALAVQVFRNLAPSIQPLMNPGKPLLAARSNTSPPSLTRAVTP